MEFKRELCFLCIPKAIATDADIFRHRLLTHSKRNS